jgi:predicted dinucleotide-binding enzyme
MRIAVLGTGVAGRTVAARLAELGHEVRHGTRDPGATRAREDWSDVPGTTLATFADAVADADLVVNASNGMASLEVLAAAGDGLAGVVLLDLANPLDFSQGFPPSLSVCNTDSLAELIQRAHPDARVVKALNTMNASLMVHPGTLADGDHTVFVCGDDEDAKATVTALLRELGHTDVLDLGGLDAARGTEMVLPLWVRLMQQLGTVHFQLKVVR